MIPGFLRARTGSNPLPGTNRRRKPYRCSMEFHACWFTDMFPPGSLEAAVLFRKKPLQVVDSIVAFRSAERNFWLSLGSFSLVSLISTTYVQSLSGWPAVERIF